jgi:hypothetical protein
MREDDAGREKGERRKEKGREEQGPGEEDLSVLCSFIVTPTNLLSELQTLFITRRSCCRLRGG